MSVAQLRAFHFVARFGGFSQAAREIAVSQSTLSGQVKALEASCGVSLLERRTRGIKLSTEGEVLYEITTRMFGAEAEARTFLKQPREAQTAGHVRVAADGPVLALPILLAMRKERPKLSFALTIDNSDRVTAQILGYHADVGVTAQPPRDVRLYGEYLLSLPIGLCVAQDHPLAGAGTVRLRDLAGQPFVMRERGSRTRAIFEKNLASAAVEIGPVLEISSRDGVREAVANGLGCGIVADREFGVDPRLAFVAISDAETAIDEYVVCLEERRHLPLVASFLREARRHGGSDLFDAAADTQLTIPGTPARSDRAMA